MKVFLCFCIVAILGVIGQNYDEHTDRGSYIFHPLCRTYEDAKQVCEEEDGHLAIINCDMEASLLATILEMFQDFHLGCEAELLLGVHYDSTVSDFLTLDGQTLDEAGYSVWAAGEPNNITTPGFESEGEQCVVMSRNKELNDLVCELDRPFVCEISGNVCYSDGSYKTHSTAKKPLVAARICEASGGHLSIINSPVEATITERAVPAVYVCS